MESMAPVTPLPVGSFVMWLPSKEVPAGWTWADGSTFDPDKYPELAAILGSSVLPNGIPGRGDYPIPFIIKTTTEHDPEPEEEEPDWHNYARLQKENDARHARFIRETKAEALREAADELTMDPATGWQYERPNEYVVWLRSRAERIERGEA